MRTKGTAAIGLVAAGLGVMLLPSAAAATQPEARIAVSTTVDPGTARPGQVITQLAEVTNTGALGLLRLVAVLDAAPGCATIIQVLPPGQVTTVACTGTASTGHSVLTAVVRGSSPLGGALYARATTRVALPVPVSPRRSVPVPSPTEAPPWPTVEPSPRAPPEAARPPERAPARPGAHPRALPRPAPRHPAATPPRPVARPEPSAAPRAAAPPRPVAARAVARSAQVGPMATPARTAAVVAVLGVMVMTVSVGAFTAALRPR